MMPLGKVNVPCAFAVHGDGGHQHVGTEHELVGNLPRGRLAGKLQEQGTHRRHAGGGRCGHLVHDVWAQALAYRELFPDDLVRLIAEGPDLIGGSSLPRADQGARLPDAVKPEERAKDAELEPAHQQLSKVRRVRVTPFETADVGRPPGDPRDAYVQAGRDLSSRCFERGVGVS